LSQSGDGQVLNRAPGIGNEETLCLNQPRQLVRNLAAMNKMGLLYWDAWALGDKGPDDDVSAEEMALLDRVAELRSIYEDDRLRVPPVITSYTEAGPRTVDLGNKQ